MTLAADERAELEDVYARYAELLDDGPLAEWPALFEEECLYLVIPRENYDQGLPLAIMRCESRGMLEDRVRAVQETIMHEPRHLRHHITNVRGLRTEGGGFSVTANYSIIEVLQDELPRILSVGRYLDVLSRSPTGKLMFAEKRVVFDSVLVPNTIVYPL
ncbi:MAG: salicylate hydroxylase [Pseudomonadales bacterium]|nr:aromatic-ring-hydroxylating dioxygenase subunit beta [Pseudomonadales bacterium]NIX06745.1 salicylate hydroxylase [Pseudomonadales bacterium]